MASARGEVQMNEVVGSNGDMASNGSGMDLRGVSHHSLPAAPHSHHGGTLAALRAVKSEPSVREYLPPTSNTGDSANMPTPRPVTHVPSGGIDLFGRPVSHRVRIAAERFKGSHRVAESSFTGSSGALAGVVDTALKRQRMLDRVKAGLEAVKVEEDATGDPLLGDENTQNFELLREQQAAIIRRATTRRMRGKPPLSERCSSCHMTARLKIGNWVTHAVVRYTIIALIFVDMLLFLLEVNGVLDKLADELKVVEIGLVCIYATEVAAKLFAFHSQFFESWWNVFDFTIVMISLVMMAIGVGMEGVLVGRSLKLFAVVHRSLRVLRIVIKVYNQGSQEIKKKNIDGHAYPIEKVVSILNKVQFSSVLSRNERKEVSSLIGALMANTLYDPNMQQIKASLAQNSEVPDWIASNFNSKPKAEKLRSGRRLSQRRLTRRVPSFAQLSVGTQSDELLATPARAVTNVDSVAAMLDDGLDMWGFDVFEFDRKTGGWPLFHVFLALAQWHGFCDEVETQLSVFASLARSLERQYNNDNSYHSSIHGADVLQTVHVLLVGGHAGRRLSPVQRLSILLAAAAHDVGHPGLTNNFLVATGATEALLRNDMAVLEHMHAYRLFKTLRKPSCAVFANVPAAVYKRQRTAMITCIISTDLSKHFEIVGQFKAHTQATLDGQEVAEWDVKQMVFMLKMADISHPTKPWLSHSEWTQRCMQEFYLQGDQEKKLGLQVSPLMDRETTNIPSAQIGFIKVLVAPLFNAWAEANIKLGWCDSSSERPRGVDGVAGNPKDGESKASVTPIDSIFSDIEPAASDDPLFVLHVIDEYLTSNLERWQAISNGDVELEWDMDVSDVGKWNEMAKRLDQALAPEVMNTSKYINLSGVATDVHSQRSPGRIFRTLDGAAALTPQQPTPDQPGSLRGGKTQQRLSNLPARVVPLQSVAVDGGDSKGEGEGGLDVTAEAEALLKEGSGGIASGEGSAKQNAARMMNHVVGDAKAVANAASPASAPLSPPMVQVPGQLPAHGGAGARR